ncbi:MAG: hypothetical protein H8E17_07540 [Deltaproteobacteria bacterium]|nr:hypothetical protein [Deltaproteobacteria bacterium]
MAITNIYKELRKALKTEIQRHSLSGQNVSITCKALSAIEAIGKPDHNDYPIIKGKEIMVEAVFEGAKGQAFTDDFENADYRVEDLLKIELNSNRSRASFISGLNAIFRYLQLCDKTIHCKDTEPKECANHLLDIIEPWNKVLLVGYQPRFLEILSSNCNVRAVDLDQDNIGRDLLGVVIEPPEMTPEAIRWCDFIFVTGSTVVNGTITNFLNQDKPVVFYGVTISATAKILNLKTYCHCGH